MNDNNNLTWEEAVLQLKADPNSTDLVSACFFDDPLIEACRRYHHSAEWKAIQKLSNFSKGAKALDVGAGRGIASYALAADGWATTALEPDSSLIVGSGAIRQIVAETNLCIEIEESWGEELPFEDGTFDLVFCRQVLHHARNLQDFCNQASRVLKPGGVLLAIREHVISKEDHLEAFLAAHPLHPLYGGEHAYTLKKYLDCMNNSGLTISRVINPLASEINTFPTPRDEIIRKLCARVHFPWPQIIPRVALSILGSTLKSPGRVYSFVAKKPIF